MTLEFKFPSNQTNLLALENTLYKIKIFYDEESAERNQELTSEVLVDIVKDELEEAVRVLLLMFIQGKALKRVKSCHFVFRAVRKPWKAAQKLKFKSNGQVLSVCPDVLEITVTTRANPAAVFKDCVHYHVVIANSSSSLRGSDSTQIEQNPQVKLRSPRSSPSKRKYSPSRSPRGKKKAKNNNLNNSECLESDEASLLAMCPKEKEPTGMPSTTSNEESERMEFVESEPEKQQMLHVERSRCPEQKSKNKNNSNNRSEQSSSSVPEQPYLGKSAHPEKRKTKTAEGPSMNLRSRRPLLQKSRLDQFVVEAEELAEEQKLQQLAQPTKSCSKTSKTPVSSRQKPHRSSLSSALDMFLTPFKYFTRNKLGKT
ncbi:uncharacterized protein LOC135475278 [Liolophura sinensis]|uniref:uncharacterized protein LOC135475278 n=1 Tax=Liolophura sinensis TaxID=3198878 RepID=UPI003158D62D